MQRAVDSRFRIVDRGIQAEEEEHRGGVQITDQGLLIEYINSINNIFILGTLRVGGMNCSKMMNNYTH